MTRTLPLWLVLTACNAGDPLTAQDYRCESPALEAHPKEGAYRRILDRALDLGSPAVTAAVRSPDGLWVGAAGVVDLELGVDAQPCHRFNIASITKVFAASAALKLAEAGALDLDARAAVYLPDDVVERVANADRVTVRQLLTHTSGVPDYVSIDYFMDGFNLGLPQGSAAEELERIYGRDAAFAPGQRYGYSNSNYLLISQVLAEAGGREGYGVVAEQVTGPLGLVDTMGMSEAGAVARGYADLHGDRALVDHTRLTRDVMGGDDKLDGGLVSTAADLVGLLDALAHDSLLSADSTQQMRTFREHREDDLETGYGLGLAAIDTPYGPAWGHYGTVYPFQSMAMHFPEQDVTVAVVINGWVPEIGDWLSSADVFAPVLD